MAGPVVVTGAARGLGSASVAIFAKRGFQVTAPTGRQQEGDYLKPPGASEIIAREELAGAGKPLGKERGPGGIGVVGSTALANVLSMTRCGGTVAACGLAGGMDLPTSVAGFILRGASLIGIDSVMRPMAERQAACKRLESGKTCGHDERDRARRGERRGREIVEGHVRGRIVVRVG